VGYPTAPAVPVTSVTVHVVAAQPTGSGNVTVSLYDGATLVGTGTPHALTSSYVEYTDTLNVSVASAVTLRTRVTFSAASGKDTQVYIVVPICTPLMADPILAGAGDISCNGVDMLTMPCKAPATAMTLAGVNPQYVFTLGDNQYENGELANYQGYYSATWGVPGLFEKTRPVVGNHEYNGNDFPACSASS